jgi:hypothetical protein
MQATTGGVRDVAYQRRDTRIDWTGNLTQPDWQHNDASGHQCLQYVVSDGDIFTVGAKGEHSWDLANVQKIEFYLDGTLQATIANQAAGTYCLDESVPPSGIHDLMAKAYVDNGDTVVSADDPNLHIDHDPPSGAVDGLPAYVRAATAIAGSMRDAHSGRRDWQAQISPSGQNSWSNANGCSLQSTPDPASGKYGCSLQTTGYADGRYDIRAMMRDNVQDPFGGPNAAATPSVSTYIDNTPPVIRLSGELWDRRDLQTIWFDDSPQLSVSATDPGSGVKNVEILVDGARSDFVEQGCGQGGCGLDHTYTFNPSVYPSSGDHTITVNSTDQLGQSSSTSWTVHVEAQSEADMPSPAPLDAPPSDQPVGPPKPEDTTAAPPDGDYGNGSLDDYCTSDPDTPSADCSATVYDPTPDDPTSGSATTESPDSSVGGLPDLGSNSVAAAGPSIYLQPGHSGWGVSDQTGSTFSDSRFTALGVTKVRLIVAYDLVPQAQADPGAVQKVDGWIDAATQAGKRILVSFGHSWVAPGHIPSVKEYSHAVRQFRARYPGVKEFTPWNEPDYPGDPLAGHGYRAGQLWRNLNYQGQSAGCTVAAGDFLDKYFTADYLTNYLNGAGHLPPRWAWHAYQDGHQRTTVKLNRFLKATTYKNHSAPGVWLTEQGGRVGDYGVTTANADLAYMLTLPNVSSRIRRFYVYQWKGDGSWDSGLIDYNPPYATRPLYNTYKAKTSP